MIGLEDLKRLATEDNVLVEDIGIKESFKDFDVDYNALGAFGVAGMEQAFTRMDEGDISPPQGMLGMWFAGVKIGMLIRDEQRRQVVEEFGEALQELKRLPEIEGHRINPEDEGDGA